VPTAVLQRHPVFVIYGQVEVGDNKNPDEQTKHAFEAFELVFWVDESYPEMADEHEAQFVLAVPHVPNWASA